jgi:membrane protease YdiL (CAAX protease family)
VPRPSMILTWVYIFIFIAVPEELFFRAWVQNLLEKRIGFWLESRNDPRAPRVARIMALTITSILFGLSHFNKRSPTFNWRYVILATIAGIFYGRAWRRNRRVTASAITHASVDAIWSLWF